MRSYDFREIYQNKKVFITGHTGFKGSWLTLWLTALGAKVHGYALPPPTTPSLFELLNLEQSIRHTVADLRDMDVLTRAVKDFQPDIIFHLAAQSVVRESYVTPLETVAVNTMGTVNLMEAIRAAHKPVAVIMVTSDKCYENKEWLQGYRENDPLGGYDPYSASKAAAEILISSWRNSFFHPAEVKVHGVRLASVRAGNVVGGGDWTTDNLVPDCIRALQNQSAIAVRNPYATRPWQHVLEALGGYLLLGAALLAPKVEDTPPFCEAFNFGPDVSSNRSVAELVEEVIKCWGSGSWQNVSRSNAHHEASLLHIAIDKAYHKLQWRPQWNFKETITHTVEWYKHAAQHPSTIRDFTLGQIRNYEEKRSPVASKSDREVMTSEF